MTLIRSISLMPLPSWTPAVAGWVEGWVVATDAGCVAGAWAARGCCCSCNAAMNPAWPAACEVDNESRIAMAIRTVRNIDHLGYIGTTTRITGSYRRIGLLRAPLSQRERRKYGREYQPRDGASSRTLREKWRRWIRWTPDGGFG